MDPESRRIVPENVNGRVQLKIVYVVLEAQYQASLAAAVRNINAKRPEVCVEIVGYLLEELRDAKNFEAFKADVASANIFIGSLIFIEELADKVRPAPWGWTLWGLAGLLGLGWVGGARLLWFSWVIFVGGWRA